MNKYLPSTALERAGMLEVLGCASFDDLYTAIPESVLIDTLNLPEGLSELELAEQVKELAEKNTVFPSIFRGAGAYHRYIPAMVQTVMNKEEFLTAYTPYQAEISQGVLQSIFEYQTMMCELTGLEVSNASLYDGAAAAAEAVFMCQERKRSRVVVSGTVHPQWLEVIQSYCASRKVEICVIPAKSGATDIDAFMAALGEDGACGLFQQPNYFGILEDARTLVEGIHALGAKAIMAAEPVSLGILQSPGELGVDICVAEGQPLGLPLSFGGPYLGIITCTQNLMRRLPGRIVGETVDAGGNRAFVLTLQAREQHIRREKASSNICSNQALCALAAGAYLACMGASGLAQAARLGCDKAHYAAQQICTVDGFTLAYSNQPYFNEFVTTCSHEIELLESYLAKRGILCGLPLSVDENGALPASSDARSTNGASTHQTIRHNALLWCTTEMNSRNQIDALVEALQQFVAEVR